MKLTADPVRPKSCRASSRPGPGNMGRETGSLHQGSAPKDGSSPEQDLNLQENLKLLKSLTTEHRFTALMIWVRQYETRDDRQKEDLRQLSVANTACINNWDFVDLSAPNIVGAHLLGRDRSGPVSNGRLRLSLGRAALPSWPRIPSSSRKSGDTFAIADQLMDDQAGSDPQSRGLDAARGGEKG